MKYWIKICRHCTEGTVICIVAFKKSAFALKIGRTPRREPDWRGEAVVCKNGYWRLFSMALDGTKKAEVLR